MCITVDNKKVGDLEAKIAAKTEITRDEKLKRTLWMKTRVMKNKRRKDLFPKNFTRKTCLNKKL
jgi:hypothetical protein